MEHSHKESVHKTTVENNLKQKTTQLTSREPSSTSLFAQLWALTSCKCNRLTVTNTNIFHLLFLQYIIMCPGAMGAYFRSCMSIVMSVCKTNLNPLTVDSLAVKISFPSHEQPSYKLNNPTLTLHIRSIILLFLLSSCKG